MRQSLIISLLFFLMVLNTTAAAVQPYMEPLAVSQMIDRMAVSHQRKHDIPGMAIAVYYQGRDYLHNYGLANETRNTLVTENTLFELASITKVFTATLLAMEVQTGSVHLDDPVVRYLPGLSTTKNLPIDHVTLRELATHSSGFPRDVEGLGISKGRDDTLIYALKTWRPSRPVGSHYQYSNIGFGLLGKALENAAHASYQDLLRKTITQPLEMSHTLINVPDTGFPRQARGYRANGMPAPHYVPLNLLGGGALRSSSSDLLKFMKAYLGVPGAPVSKNLFLALQLAVSPFYKVNSRFDMGLGWQRVTRSGKVYITKNGMNQGFNTFIGFDQKDKFGVVVLTNKRDGKAETLGTVILDRLAAGR
ncbi:Beta-lactamase [Aquicella siphonis]|uniref:Beta-lactamase n=1 Tax=Aquicella siphonis TaxID=254247 RepID=A0A5E4PJE3_9COXI|nr:serine hydrolase [Aquicella siphonis]VVC77199.1 Beta-lactamase [Aquicella siphonis]